MDVTAGDSLHPPSVLHCRRCKTDWNDPKSLLSHVETVHHMLSKAYPCYDCRLTGFTRERNLRAHKLSGACLGPNWELSWDSEVNKHASTKTTPDRLSEKENTFTSGASSTSSLARSSHCSRRRNQADDKSADQPDIPLMNGFSHRTGEPLSKDDPRPSTHDSNGGAPVLNGLVEDRENHTKIMRPMADKERLLRKNSRKRHFSVFADASTSCAKHMKTNLTWSSASAHTDALCQLDGVSQDVDHQQTPMHRGDNITKCYSGRRSLLDWDSFISLSKKHRRLSLQPNGAKFAVNKMSPSSNFNAASTCNNHGLNQPSQRLEPDSYFTQPYTSDAGTQKNHFTGISAYTTKHPKAIAGSTIHFDRASAKGLKMTYSPELLGHRVNPVPTHPLPPVFPAVTNKPGGNLKSFRQSIKFRGRFSNRLASVDSANSGDTSVQGVIGPITLERLSGVTSGGFLRRSVRKSKRNSYSPVGSSGFVGTVQSLVNNSDTHPTDDHMGGQIRPTADDYPSEVVISRNNLRPRKSSTSPSVAMCPYCSRTMLYPMGLKRHLRLCRAQSDEDFDNMHENAITPVRQGTKITQEIRPTTESALTPITHTQFHDCPYCARRCSNSGYLKLHIRACKLAPTTFKTPSKEINHEQFDSLGTPPLKVESKTDHTPSDFANRESDAVGSQTVDGPVVDDLASCFAEGVQPATEQASPDTSIPVVFPSVSASEEQKREVADMLNGTSGRLSDKHQTSDDFDVAEQTSRAVESVCCPHCPRQFARPWHLKLHLHKCPESLAKQLTSEPPALRPRLRSRSSTPHFQRRFSSADHISNPDSTIEYSCDPAQTYPGIRLRIRMSRDNSAVNRSSCSTPVLSSLQDSDVATLFGSGKRGRGRQRLVETHVSTGSLTSSMDDVRSNVSDATTMPAHSDNNSLTLTAVPRDLTCTWCHRSDFASFRLLSIHRNKCTARQKSFTRSRSTGRGHIQTRNKLSLSIRLWPCPSCGLKFRSNPVLRAHMAGNCSQALKRRRQQLLQADGKMYCPGCSKTSQPFESVDDVLAHLLSLKPNVGHAHANHGPLSRAQCWPSYLAVPNLGFGCPICGLLLASESRLDKHKRAVHELWLRVEHQKALSPKKNTLVSS
ncbi:hypothetical protein P879_05077 [Paragonimus westermani]|uniref:C2H2-type domain-containing protein n=1 Tax=Paragonimus westermani TaxID=34504 RepID=A0A8T0DJ77_9TREM|nr:hypothetical protein P879_05077 [Paragonimus westermani]